MAQYIRNIRPDHFEDFDREHLTSLLKEHCSTPEHEQEASQCTRGAMVTPSDARRVARALAEVRDSVAVALILDVWGFAQSKNDSVL